MAGNAREFTLQLSKEWQAKQEDIAEAVAVIGLECLSRVVRKSPVDTGRFKGNWVTSIASPSMVTREIEDKSGSVSIKQGADDLAGYANLSTMPVIYIQNNLPYANRLENGWSKQAPKGMVALTVAEVSIAFDGRDV